MFKLPLKQRLGAVLTL